MRNRMPRIEHLDVADHFVHRPETQFSHQLTNLFGDVLEERLNELGLAGITPSQFGVLSRNSDRASIEMAHPHHDAARHHQRGRCEPELFRTEQRCHHYISTRFHLSVGLDHDAIA